MDDNINNSKKHVKSVKPAPQGFLMEVEFPELFEKLTGWGLTKYETSVYLYLLGKSVPSGGSKIAIGAKLHRPYVYTALPRLIELSLVVEIANGKQSKYKAMPPSQLEKLEMKRVVETSELTEALNKISKISYDQDAEVYIGKEAIIKHQLEWARQAPKGMTQYLLGGSAKAMQKMFEHDLHENARIQGEKGFTFYYLCNEEEKHLYDEYSKNNVKFHIRSMNIIPELLPTIAIRGDVVEIHSYFNPPIMYVIKSKDVAEKFKVFFLGLWDMAGEKSELVKI
ncbi:MAG: hypothetical protein NTW35_00040 [Candidatus Nomurabacteria bacterium]|nr:hypothetical protein [Candidatus Nomurabacteria bacterium]